MTMMWIHKYRPTSDWYTLHAEEQHRLMKGWADASSRADGRCIGAYSIRGQSEMDRLEIWEFDDLEAVERHWQAWLAADYADWRVSSNLVGAPLTVNNP
jgi:hypothetical protein